jgi:hypothetical protein
MEPEPRLVIQPPWLQDRNRSDPDHRGNLNFLSGIYYSQKATGPQTWVNFARGDPLKWWRSKSETELRIICGDDPVAVRQKKQTGLNLCGGDQAGLLFPHGGVWGSPGERTITT